MDRLGERLRQRARELGLTDSEVARRLGLSQARYAHYVRDKREPDFQTFVKICRILAASPNSLLGFEELPALPGEEGLLQERLKAAIAAMSIPTLRVAATVMDALVHAQTEE